MSVVKIPNFLKRRYFKKSERRNDFLILFYGRKEFQNQNQLIPREVNSITGFRGGARSELACSAYRHSEFYHQKKKDFMWYDQCNCLGGLYVMRGGSMKL